MLILRAYLLLGLVLHKAVWEVLKRRAPGRADSSASSITPLAYTAKAVKMLILAGLVAQIFLPDLLPITDGLVLRAVGVALFTVNLAIAVHSRVELGRNWSDIEASGIVPGHRLIDKGMYRFVRHPIYIADLTMLVGFELALNSWLVLGVLLLYPVVMRQARNEERVLRSQVPGYEEYCQRTKAFVPFVI